MLDWSSADLQEDLLAGESMFVSELSEGHTVNMGNPEMPLTAVVVDGKRTAALFAEIPMSSPLGAFFNRGLAVAIRTLMLVFFLAYSWKLVLI